MAIVQALLVYAVPLIAFGGIFLVATQAKNIWAWASLITGVGMLVVVAMVPTFVETAGWILKAALIIASLYATYLVVLRAGRMRKAGVRMAHRKGRPSK